MDKMLKRQHAAIVLFYIHSAVEAALDPTRNPDLDLIELAESIDWVCSPYDRDEEVDVLKRISNAADDNLPGNVAFCLQRIWEALPPYEARRATELVCATLIGAATHRQLEYLNRCTVLAEGYSGSNLPFIK